MDDTQPSRTTDATATRKRRSSILKSQRAPRAPLSELEFHVTTPTDTAKSRRVSFSRRTGVAEFATNEATTTWKNFYEEHNKSLESSGNLSAANAPRPSSVGHLGKRIFEDQFQEVEVIDYGSTVDDTRGVEDSINNVKFDQFAVEWTADDRKLTAPGPHFERSTFTVSEHTSKLFGNDLAISGLADSPGKINVNFSTMQPIGDDLDEIQKDLQMHQANHQNFIFPGPQNGRTMSGYIEVDLNTTHAAVDCEAYSLSEDMSITDTIHSPKVNVSKNGSSLQTDKCLNKDWVTDKENIAVNPYVAPKESANFTVNEIPDKVLVFDGKRLTLQSEREPVTDYRKTLISSEQPNKTPQRKTIVINVDDDLPNFVANPHTSMSQHYKNCTIDETLQRNSCDISMTQPLSGRIETSSNKRRTIVFADTSGDISMTQALPTNIAPEKHEKRMTIVFDNDTADISVTQAVPASVIIPAEKVSVNESPVKKRQAMVFENETSNISITQALPTNMILGNSEVTEKRKTIVFNDDDGNISVTKAIPSNILLSEEVKYLQNTPLEETDEMLAIPSSKLEANKRKTIVFNDEDGNISVTKVIPSNILLSKEAKYYNNFALEDTDAILPISSSKIESNKRKTIVFTDEDGNISVTKAIPTTLLFTDEAKPLQNTSLVETRKRKTIVFNNEDGNISVTKEIPSNILISEEAKNIQNTPMGETYAISFSSSAEIEANKRKTIVFNDEDGNVSVTKVIPSNILLLANSKTLKSTFLEEIDVLPSSHLKSERGESIVPNQEDGNISLTNVVPSNLILPDKETTENVTLNNEVKKKTTTGTLHPNVLLENFGFLDEMQYSSNQSHRESSRPKITIAYEDDIDISMTQALPSNIITSEKRKTIVYDEDSGNISNTEAVPNNLILPARHSTVCNTDSVKMSSSEAILVINSVNNVEQKDTTTKSCQVTSSKLAKISKAMDGFLLENNKSIAIKTESKNLSVTQVVSSYMDLTISAKVKTRYSMDKNSEDIHVTEAESIILRKEACALNPVISNALSPTVNKQETVAKLDHDVSTTATANTEKKRAHISFINLEDTLNGSQLKKLKNELKNENISNQKVCMSDLKNVTGMKDELNNSNINTSTDGTQQVTRNVTFCEVADNIITKNNYQERGDAFSEISPNECNEKSIIIPPSKDDVMKPDIVTASDRVISALAVEPLNSHMGLKLKKDSNTTIGDVIIPFYSNSTIHDFNISNIQITTKSNSNSTSTSTTTSASENNLFYIIKDCDRGIQTENLNDNKANNVVDHGLKTSFSKPQVEAQSNIKKEDLKRDIDKITSECKPTNKVESNPGRIKNIEISFNPEVKRKSCRDANCTKDLLDMLSKFTDQEEQDTLIPPVTDTCTVLSENKTDIAPERLVSHPRRQSVVLSREDLMNNISMAQALLQSLAASETDDSEPDSDVSADTPPPKRNSRVSSDVVKTLHFDDDDTTLITPLKNTINERSSLSEKCKKDLVIPTYLRDHSSKIEAVMNGLVNPEEDRQCNQKYATCESQVQTNLISSNKTERSTQGCYTHSHTDQTAVGAIPFDLHNPLNNVLLAPINIKDTSRYEPYKDTLKPSDNSAHEESLRNRNCKVLIKDVESKDNIMQLDSGISKNTSHESSRVLLEEIESENNIMHLDSETSKNASHESSGVLLKEIESEDNMMHLDSGTSKNASHESFQNISCSPIDSHIEVIYSKPQELPLPVESNVESVDGNMKKKYEKRKHKTCSQSLVEVTPKPASKIQKRSVSPVADSSNDSDRSKQHPDQEVSRTLANKSPLIKEKSLDIIRPLNETPTGEMDVQQLAADHHTEKDNLKNAAVGKSKHNSSGGSEMKNMKEDVNNGIEMETQSIVRPPTPNFAAEQRDALTGIDHLPCIRSGEVEWESRSDCEWSFLLVYKRVRVIVSLAPSCAVTDLVIEHAQSVEITNKGNAGGALCLRFAIEAMRRVMSCGVGERAWPAVRRAGDVAGGLKRCATVAQLASRWAREMRLSWQRLGCSLQADGRLTLCVANIPLRSVWEVSMNIELATDAEVPYPEARDVQVSAVVTSIDVTDRDVTRALEDTPTDWGHAPKTLWKIFKYLKNKLPEGQSWGFTALRR